MQAAPAAARYQVGSLMTRGVVRSTRSSKATRTRRNKACSGRVSGPKVPYMRLRNCRNEVFSPPMAVPGNSAGSFEPPRPDN